ncbi:Uncharacterized protein TCM_025421 [Theobroma cacao]|uniref:Uncharacterized protein n=1 Tax=Theobroma cacao TaxID=3641 RepID=A0A061EZE3_THECC|nr:Uncharacterized protein TCM_025421 [Theobroma cacao]
MVGGRVIGENSDECGGWRWGLEMLLWVTEVRGAIWGGSDCFFFPGVLNQFMHELMWFPFGVGFGDGFLLVWGLGLMIGWSWILCFTVALMFGRDDLTGDSFFSRWCLSFVAKGFPLTFVGLMSFGCELRPWLRFVFEAAAG